HRRPRRPRGGVRGDAEGDRREAAHEHRRLHAGTALLPRLRPDLARDGSPRDRAHARAHGPALAGALARERAAVEPQGIPRRVGLQGRRRHGASRRPARAYLVSPPGKDPSMRRFSIGLACALLLSFALPALAGSASDFDKTCSPCKDFDQFANGGWTARTKLPPGYTNFGAFDELYDRNEAVLRKILEKVAADQKAAAGSDRARLRDYYNSCMDSAGAERAGGKPIAGLLADVDGMGSVQDLGRQLGWMHANGVAGLFGFFSAQDPKPSETVIAFLTQSGLGLPDRDFYTRSDSTSVATRATYVRVTANLLKLAGEDAAAAQRHADAVMALETALANASMT